MDFVRGATDKEKDQATRMLETIDDLCPDSQSPTFDEEKMEESATGRARDGRCAMFALQGLMSMQLHGCSNGGGMVNNDSWFKTTCLMVWTIMLGTYTWWMLRNPRFNYVAHLPERHPGYTVGHTPEPTVTADDLRAETIATWNLARSLKRLKRTHEILNPLHLLRVQR